MDSENYTDVRKSFDAVHSLTKAYQHAKANHRKFIRVKDLSIRTQTFVNGVTENNDKYVSVENVDKCISMAEAELYGDCEAYRKYKMKKIKLNSNDKRKLRIIRKITGTILNKNDPEPGRRPAQAEDHNNIINTGIQLI